MAEKTPIPDIAEPQSERADSGDGEDPSPEDRTATGLEDEQQVDTAGLKPGWEPA